MAACGPFTLKGKRWANPIALARRFRHVFRSRRAGHWRGRVASRGGYRLCFHHWRGADDRRRFNNRCGFFNGGNGRFFDNSGFFFGNRWLRSDGFFSSWSRCGLSFFDYRLCWLTDFCLRHNVFCNNCGLFNHRRFFDDRGFNDGCFCGRFAGHCRCDSFSCDGFRNDNRSDSLRDDWCNDRLNVGGFLYR